MKDAGYHWWLRKIEKHIKEGEGNGKWLSIRWKIVIILESERGYDSMGTYENKVFSQQSSKS